MLGTHRRAVPFTFLTLAAAMTPLLTAAPAALGDDAVSPNWFRYPAISPDGKTVVFVHAGDLYTMPVEGGRAYPLTVHEGHETRPVFSPDGKAIAFASDRHGNFDVFVMPAEGGPATRLTYYSASDYPSAFTVDGSAVIFDSSRVPDVNAANFPTGALSQLYSVPVTGGTPTRLLTTPAINARFDSTGRKIVYEDRKGFEDEFRKHHTSSVTRDIWVYDTTTGKHNKITSFEGEDRDPHFMPDGRSVIYLSERGGDMNVYRMSLTGDEQATPLTSFEHHPVRQLTVAKNGRAVFSWHGDLYRMDPGQPAQKIPVQIAVDGRGLPSIETRRGGVSGFSPAKSGKEVAFVLRGEVFVTSTDFGTTRRITNTPEQERSVDFAPDGRSLVYAGERDGSWNLYLAKIADEDELYFFSATKIEEEELLNDGNETFQPKFSPDGKKVAFLSNRSTLRVIDLESREVVTALPGTAYYSYADGDYWFDWSPNSEWLAVHYYANQRAFSGHVGIVKADGSMADAIDISRWGYSDVTPQWAMKGGALIWSSDRFGMRSHGSWGSQDDVVAAFLTQDSYDRFRMTKEEYELSKELEEARKKREDKKKDDAKKDENSKDEDKAEDPSKDNADNASEKAAVAEASADEEPAKDDESDAESNDENKDEDKDKEEDKPEPLKLELDNLEDRVVRLTMHSSDLSGFALSPDGDKLYYLARFERGYDLWVRNFREESTSILRKLNAGSASMTLSEDGKTIYLLANGSLSKIDTASGNPTPISFNAELNIDGMGEREYLFDHVWRQTLQKFYRKDMHGVDWNYYRAQYQPKLAGIKDNRAFADLLSEILGELNASHTGGRYYGGGGEGASNTASLGVFYESRYAGDGWRIAEVIAGGPLAKADSKIEAGMVITHIDGVPLTASQNLYEPLDRKAGQRVRLTVRSDEPEAEPFEVVVKPISLGQENELRYQRWIKQRHAIVEAESGGRIGYMHIRGMNDASFRAFFAEVLGRNATKDAIVVDTRYNGGGWLHDDLVTFLTGQRYVDLYPRDDESPDTWYHGDSMWRWTKPSIVVMSEGNYSDAHFFPWAYKEVGIGDLVGMPVPGTATAVWWESLHTGDLVFGIPQIGTKGKRGIYLENKQLEPDHLVPLPPDDLAAGKDTQLIEATRILLKQVDSK